MRIFVVGNGVSRRGINIEQLKEFGKVIGCNALYRDCLPNVLVAVDPAMVIEISESKIQDKIPVYTYRHSKIQHLPGFKIINHNLGWSSGSTALYLATKEAPKEIYLLGFDFVSTTGSINNMYAGTKNYKPANSLPIPYFNWESQIISIIKKTPYINFFRVSKDTTYQLPEKFKNFFEIEYDDFNKNLNFWKSE